MLFDVAYPFTARYLLRRHRNPTWMTHVGRLTLDIPEIAEADFPAGFAVKTVDLDRRASDTRLVRFDIRIHDDACWWPLREPTDGRIVPIERFRAVAAEGGFLFDDAVTRFSRRQLVGTGGCFPRTPLPDPAITKRMIESDEDAVAVDLQRRAADDLRLFGGTLYVRGNEPVLQIRFSEPHRRVRQARVVLAEDVDENTLWRDEQLIARTFRVDEAELARTLAARAMAAQDTGKPHVETCTVEILPSPYRLRFDPVTPALVRAASKIREEAGKIRTVEATGISREEVLAATDPADPARLAATLKPLVERLKAVEDAAGRRSPAVLAGMQALVRVERARQEGRMSPGRALSEKDEEALAALALG